MFGSLTPATIETPDLINAEAQPDIETPDLITSQNQPDVETPDLLEAQPEADINTPDLIGSETQPDLPTPSAVTPVTGTATTPPFPLNHARIQWDNLLFSFASVFSNGGTNPEYTLAPNTYQRWEASGNVYIQYVLASNQDVDTVCIGAHNLGGKNYDVGVFYRETNGGSLIPFTPAKTPTTDNAIMFHVETPVNAKTIEIYFNTGTLDFHIGYISVGEALQMQRPFFNGHTPVTDERFTEFYTSWTETYNIIGREVRRRGQENSPSWNNLSDTWYRTYLEPIKDTLEVLPFFFAWNLDEYPDDVGLMILTNFFSAPMQNGSMIRRDVTMQMRGAL